MVAQRTSSAGFVPSDRQVRAVQALLVATAHEEAVRPIVEAYQKVILADHQFRPSQTWEGYPGLPDVVVDPGDAHLLSPADMAVYSAECVAARDALSLQVGAPDLCPLMEARAARIARENALLVSMADTPRFASLANARRLPGDNCKQAITWFVTLVAPYCRQEPAPNPEPAMPPTVVSTHHDGGLEP